MVVSSLVFGVILLAMNFSVNLDYRVHMFLKEQGFTFLIIVRILLLSKEDAKVKHVHLHLLLTPTQKIGENLTLRCITKDTSTIPHEKVKRQLRFRKRQVIGKALVDNGVSNWQRKIATEEMEHGDIEPLLLYKSSVLRKLKQEYNDKILDVNPKDGNDPIYYKKN